MGGACSTYKKKELLALGKAGINFSNFEDEVILIS